MNCQYCNNFNEDTTQYCSQCGKPTVKNYANSTNPNVVAVWLYAGYLIFSSVFYRVLGHVIIPKMMENPYQTEKISTLYNVTGFILLVIELVILSVIIGIIKDTTARIAVGIIAAFTLLMFIADKATVYLH